MKNVFARLGSTLLSGGLFGARSTKHTVFYRYMQARWRRVAGRGGEEEKESAGKGASPAQRWVSFGLATDSDQGNPTSNARIKLLVLAATTEATDRDDDQDEAENGNSNNADDEGERKVFQWHLNIITALTAHVNWRHDLDAALLGSIWTAKHAVTGRRLARCPVAL